MKCNIKKISLMLICAFVIGGTAFFVLNGKPPTEASQSDESSAIPNGTVNVNEIDPADKENEINPSDILPSESDALDVIDPSNSDTDVVVPLNDPVEKPSEANPDKHEKGNEDAPPKPATTSPTTSKPTPPKSNEPKNGDTNETGQVWVPGFGWVTPGGENQVIPGHSDGDINKQVGDM